MEISRSNRKFALWVEGFIEKATYREPDAPTLVRLFFHKRCRGQVLNLLIIHCELLKFGGNGIHIAIINEEPNGLFPVVVGYIVEMLVPVLVFEFVLNLVDVVLADFNEARLKNLEEHLLLKHSYFIEATFDSVEEIPRWFRREALTDGFEQHCLVPNDVIIFLENSGEVFFQGVD